MNDLFYVKKFIRSDGEYLSFDQNEIYLDQDNTLLQRPTPDTTAVSYTEANGGEMIRQQTGIYSQDIAGLIVPKDTPYWSLVLKLTTFFKINYTYKIVYVRKDGAMFAVDNAWISEGLQVPPEPHEDYARWSVAFDIGSESWREYSEDASGKETFANSVVLPIVSGQIGGEKWDSVGLVANSIGEVWIDGEGGVQDVSIASSGVIYPVWVVEGECVNPTLRNNSTDTVAKYNGTVAAGQTLTVNFETGVAYLDSALVTRNVEGVVKCRPGLNTMGFNSDSGTTTQSLIQWNNTIG